MKTALVRQGKARS